MTFLLFIKTVILLFLIDLIWLSTGGRYALKMTKQIQNEPVNFRYIGGLIVYCVLAYMSLQTKSYKEAFLYGISIYSVYDFTNYALLKNYDLKFAIADSLWGGILFVIVFYFREKMGLI